MAGTPTRCGFCGRQTITRAGRCPACGQRKSPPPPRREPPPPPSFWQQFGSRIAALAVTILLIITAIAIGAQILLFLSLIVLCALIVMFVVASGTS